jgi:cell wall-associated NlpC family hydrolase
MAPAEDEGAARIAVLAVVGAAGLLLLGLITVPMMLVGGASMLFTAGSGCSGQQGGSTQPPVSAQGQKSIPADYLALYKKVGQQYGVPWAVLAGIGTVESDNGRSSLPGVHSGSNAFGAAGPMQIGISGAAGNSWGGAPIHPAGEKVNGVATDEDGNGTASVYDPADAIAGAAKYLLAHQVQTDAAGAVFAYNHLQSYVQSVLSWASAYAKGGFSVVSAVSGTSGAAACLAANGAVANIAAPNQGVSTAIAFAEQQLGKPYLWGGTGPDAFDCSGLVMMAYRAAGIDIPRTSQEQWTWGPRIQASQAEPGDLVFFPGSDGTIAAPGHVGIVIGGGKMIEAYATGTPLRIASYLNRVPVGFTRPWAHAGVILPSQQPAAVASG